MRLLAQVIFWDRDRVYPIFELEEVLVEVREDLIGKAILDAVGEEPYIDVAFLGRLGDFELHGVED